MTDRHYFPSIKESFIIIFVFILLCGGLLVLVFNALFGRYLSFENGLMINYVLQFIPVLTYIFMKIRRNTPEPEEGKLRVVLTARMIVEKGVFILTKAAEKLRPKYGKMVEFQLIGGLDDHPGAITEAQLQKVCDGEYIRWLGYRTDVKALLMQCHIVAFPSYYMEGLPKSLIEADAIGRPVITCNSVGCKEAVIDGYNGFLIPTKDVDILAEKLDLLLSDKALRQRMGRNSRAYAEKYFSIDSVVEKHLEIYEELIAGR